MSEFLHKNGLFLIYLRGYFEEFKNDETVKEVLVKTRSMDKYENMESCIKEEREYWEQFKEAASDIKTYYENKTTLHIKTNALKEGGINEVKFE